MSRVLGFMSGANTYGRWVPEQNISAHAVMGEATIDFSQAIFTHPKITISTTAVWGGVTVVVPPNVMVEQNGQAILGGFAGGAGIFYSSTGEDSTLTTSSSSGITIAVNGTAVMGAITAVVNKKAPPAELVSAEEAERIIREVPAPISTTRHDLIQQTLDEAFMKTQAVAKPPGQPIDVQAAPGKAEIGASKTPALTAPEDPAEA